jgi:hypothetical protein
MTDKIGGGEGMFRNQIKTRYMNRTQRRKMERNMNKGISFDKNPRVPHLRNINTSMKPFTGGFVFDKDRISQDNRLYMLYNLPNDDLMKLVVKKNIENFETMLEQGNIKVEEDVIKLDLYMTFFEGCLNDGILMENYKNVVMVKKNLTKLFENMEQQNQS